MVRFCDASGFQVASNWSAKPHRTFQDAHPYGRAATLVCHGLRHDLGYLKTDTTVCAAKGSGFQVARSMFHQADNRFDARHAGTKKADRESAFLLLLKRFALEAVVHAQAHFAAA